MQFPGSLESAALIVGAKWLTELRRAIAGFPHGEGDFSIGRAGSGNLQLWFWWQPAIAT